MKCVIFCLPWRESCLLLNLFFCAERQAMNWADSLITVVVVVDSGVVCKNLYSDQADRFVRSSKANIFALLRQVLLRAICLRTCFPESRRPQCLRIIFRVAFGQEKHAWAICWKNGCLAREEVMSWCVVTHEFGSGITRWFAGAWVMISLLLPAYSDW